MYSLMRKKYNTLSYIILAGTIVYLSSVMALVQQDINHWRIEKDISTNLVIEPGSFTNIFMISGFEGLVADLLWLRMDEEWHKGRWYEMLPMVTAVTYIQPNFLQAWEMGGWHLAYNMSSYTKDKRESEQFIDEGIKFLKRGIAKNRDKWELYFNLGWIYYNRLQDYEKAIACFRNADRFKHPSYVDRLIAHAYRKLGNRIKEAEEWKRCIALHPDDEYNREIADKFLKAIKGQT